MMRPLQKLARPKGGRYAVRLRTPQQIHLLKILQQLFCQAEHLLRGLLGRGSFEYLMVEGRKRSGQNCMQSHEWAGQIQE